MTNEMNEDKTTRQRIGSGDALRRLLSKLIGADYPGQIVLCPGILIGVQTLFANLGLRRILITTQEYYEPWHFPFLETGRIEVSSLPDLVQRATEAIIVSVVSWRGEVLPVRRIFTRLRADLGSACPLLVADYTHAGAVGFPTISQLGADIVCGDASKWIAPIDHESKLAFLWTGPRIEERIVRRAFGPFFLAMGGWKSNCRSRWVDPCEVEWLNTWFQEKRLNRAVLKRRHTANMKLAKQLADRLKLQHPKSAILWLENGESPEIEALEKSGLVWRLRSGGLRVLCRADALLLGIGRRAQT